MEEHLFSYGTLQKDSVQLKLFGRLLHGTQDTLKGYKPVAIEIRDESFLAKGEQKDQRIALPSGNKDDCIEGTVFEVSEQELLLADKYEPVDYKRVQVELQSGKKAWIYVTATNDQL